MVMKAVSYLFFLLLLPVSVFAQMLTGKVKSADNKAIFNVTCKLFNDKDSLLAYTFTKQDGTYTIAWQPAAHRLEFSAIGYKKQNVLIKADRYGYDATLISSAIKLKEVTVTVEPIKRNKDTLLYNADAFRQKEDRYLEDVLKRLPGIEVGSNGEIIYQGKSINKFNIEGLDLMGNRYNQATQNMPAEAVTQIQIMENNQPIRALEDKVNSNRATLNIKLKKDYKMRPFGEIEGGIGFPATIWDNRLTSIGIATKNQFFVSAMMNNSGIDLSPLTKDMTVMSDKYLAEPLPTSFLYSPTVKTPPVSQLYYLNNKSYYIGANYLHAFSKYANLRTNLLYHHNTTFKDDSTFVRYVSNDTVNIFERNGIKDRNDIVKAQIRYELNTKKLYLYDEVLGSLGLKDAHNEIKSNIGSVGERVWSNPYFLQNTFNADLNTPNHLYTFSSVIRAYKAKEKLTSLFKGWDRIFQPIDMYNFFMRNRVSTAFDVFGNSLTFGYILEYKYNTLATDKVSHQASRYWLNTIEPTYEISFDKGYMDISLPVEYLSYNYGWRYKNSNKVLFSPSVDLEYKLNNMLTADISLGYNRNGDTEKMFFNGILNHNYRTYSKMIDSLSVERMSIANLRLAYINTFDMLSWNIYVGWMHAKNDYFLNYSYTDDATFIRPVWRDNDRSSWSVAMSLKKIFRSLGITFNYGNRYSYNKSFLSQNTVEDYIRYNVFGSNLSLNWNKLSWLHANVSGVGNISWKGKDRFSYDHSILRNAYYAIRLDFFPIKRLRLYTDFSQTIIEITQKHYSTNYFLNAGLRYDVLKFLAIKFSATNLLNRKYYTESLYSGANYQYFEFPLRGREVMFSLSVKY